MSKLLQAFLEHKQSNDINAEKSYLEWLKKNPKDIDGWQLLGILYAQSANNDQAIKAFTTAIK